MSTLNAVRVNLDGTTERIELQADGDSVLDALQAEVGGFVDVIDLGGNRDLWLNDEGMIAGLERNRLAESVVIHERNSQLHQTLHGVGVITRHDSDGSTTGLTDDDLAYFTQYESLAGGVVINVPMRRTTA